MNRSSLSGAIIALLTVVPAFADDGANGIDLQLEEAQRLAVSQQPLLAAQTQAVKAARENAVAAAQLPDPKLAVGVTDWPINGADRYSLRRDEFTMVTIGVMQDFPRALKRRLRGQRGEHEAELQQQMLDATRLAICRDAGIAWLDVWKPEQSLKLVLAAAHEAELQKQVTQTAYTTGRVTQAEVLAAKVALALLRDEVTDVEQQDQDARDQLARWIGAEASQLPSSSELPQWQRPAPLAEMLTRLRTHPHLNTEVARVAITGDDVALAKQAYKPDWSVELSYGYRPDFADYVSLNFTVDLPVFTAKRQDRSLGAKLAEQEQARQASDDVLRQHEAELRRHWEDWQRLQDRLRQFDTNILPQSEQRIAAALASWRTGQGTLLGVLDARRIALENQIKRLALEADAAKHRVHLEYFSGERP